MPVMQILNRSGWPVIIFEADRVASGQAKFTVQMNDKDGLKIFYSGYEILLDQVAAAWYRRPLAFDEEVNDKAKELTIERDRKSLQSTLWQLLNNDIWLNAPSRIQYADIKLIQLKVAKDLGFDFPPTLVTNAWDEVGANLPESIVYKPHNPVFFIDNRSCMVYAKKYKNPEALPTQSNPFPGLWQTYIRKVREWRITVVGDKTFDASIYTKANARDDWRKHQDRPGRVTFKAEDFPERYQKLCLDYLKHFKLKFGAFDFIESEGGRITFLECNPNGQYGWLEENTGLQISEAIAKSLMEIAESNIKTGKLGQYKKVS
jgi:glutathione synthase/RimK-type ligase-like ATP-grasp enzyme